MAAIPITLDGVLYDLYNRTTQRVILIGDASLTGVGIGGGPIAPPSQPPSIWPSPGRPAHPIYWPPGIWPSPEHPAHPIVLPPEGGIPPTEPPTEPPSQPPNASWEWGWNPSVGWIPVFVPGDKPSPPPS